MDVQDTIKKFKNFLNLSYHLKDFEIKAVLNFFASCHGKSNCDGVGAAAKRKLRNKSPTVGPQDAILTSTAAFEYVSEAMSSIQFFHIRQDGIEGEKMLEERYKKGCTVPGIRSFHHFPPTLLVPLRTNVHHPMMYLLELKVSLFLHEHTLLMNLASKHMLPAHMMSIGGLA